MYQYIRSYLKQNNSNTPYQNVDVSSMSLEQILTKYTAGYLVLKHPVLSHESYIDLNTLRKSNLPINTKVMLSTWLNELGDLRIPELEKEPSYTESSVYYRDAVLAGFKVDMTEPYELPGTDAVITNKENIYVQYTIKAFDTLPNKVITTVNGMAHRNTPFEHGIHIVGGGVSALHAKDMNVGILSFEDISDIIQIPLTTENIRQTTKSTPYNDSFMISLDMDVNDYTFVLSLGGYLFINPDWIIAVDPDNGLLRVSTKHLDIPQLLNRSKHLIDLSPLGITNLHDDKEDLNYGLLRLQDVNSDIVLSKWLTLPQSFICIVKTSTLTTQYEKLHWTGVYGKYEYHKDPLLPIVDHYGRMPEYWVKRQNDTYIVEVADPVYKSRLHLTASEDDKQFINDIMPYHAELYEPMSLVKITSSVLNKTK